MTWDDLALYFGLFMFSLCFLAWLTHVIVCLANSAWGFLIAGAIFFPIGVVHGIGIWIGAW